MAPPGQSSSQPLPSKELTLFRKVVVCFFPSISAYFPIDNNIQNISLFEKEQRQKIEKRESKGT